MQCIIMPVQLDSAFHLNVSTRFSDLITLGLEILHDVDTNSQIQKGRKQSQGRGENLEKDGNEASVSWNLFFVATLLLQMCEIKMLFKFRFWTYQEIPCFWQW